MTPEEWNKREATYVAAIGKINISNEISTAEIKSLVSQLDRCFSDAYLDFARAKSAYESASMQEKLVTKEFFVAAKETKASDKMAEAFAAKSAEDRGTYKTLDESRRRYNFMQAVINILSSKKDMLITDSGVLKLEASLK